MDIMAAAGRERVTRLKVSTAGQVNEHFLNIRDVTEIEDGEFCGDVTKYDLLINDIPGSSALICDGESSTSLPGNQDQKFLPSYVWETTRDCRITRHYYLSNMSISDEEDIGVCGSFIGDVEIGDFNGDGFVDLYVGGYEDWGKGITWPFQVLINEKGKSFKLSRSTSRTRAR